MGPALALSLSLFLTLSSTWVASTINVKSPWRNSCSLVAIAILVACFFSYDNGSDELIPNRKTRAAIGTAFAADIFVYFEKLLCSKWNLDAGGPEMYRRRQTQPSKSVSRYALDLWVNPRGIRQPWQVKNVPHFSSLDPKYVPSRAKFLVTRFASFVCCVLVLDLSAYAITPSTKLYPEEAVPVFGCVGSLSTNLTMFRLGSTVVVWLQFALTIISAMDVAALVAVAFGLSNPQDWPPLMGSPYELYTIRNFWG